jgi:hypothetical protein
MDFKKLSVLTGFWFVPAIDCKSNKSSFMSHNTSFSIGSLGYMEIRKSHALHKSGNLNNINNYRPTSVLSSISKIIEKIANISNISQQTNLFQANSLVLEVDTQ